MKKININKINKKNILDLMYEPCKIRINENGKLEYYGRYSVLEYNGTRKQITRKEFFSLCKQLRSLL